MAFKGIKRERMSIHNSNAKISFLQRELDMALARSDFLERENKELKQEISKLRSQVSALKAHENERKSMLWKKFQNSTDSTSRLETTSLETEGRLYTPDPTKAHNAGAFSKGLPTRPVSLPETTAKTPIFEIIMKPAEKFKKIESEKGKPLQLQKVRDFEVSPVISPPPPPPPPSNLLLQSKAVRRVPELVEFYRLLMKREAQKEKKSGSRGTNPDMDPKNMIGEIENRSTHVLAVKSDVETQREFINSLAKAVETATFDKISKLEAFVKWLDNELSKLVDERAVLKHFPQWPEKKADALREAAFSFRDLQTLETEVLLFKDEPKQLFTQSLRKAQTLLDRLEQSSNNVERGRDGTIKKYMGFNIPSQWLQDNGVIGQLRLSSLTLARAIMKRVAKELEHNEFPQEELLVQGVRFAFRVHQFAGGFDVETKQAFDEIKKIGSNHK